MDNFFKAMSENSINDDGIAVFTYAIGDNESSLIDSDGYPVFTVDCEDVKDFEFHMGAIKDEYLEATGISTSLSLEMDGEVAVATFKRMSS